MLRQLQLSLAVVLLTSLGQAIAVDDSVCVFKVSTWSCQPAALCSYQYKFGDLTPSESCRVRPGANTAPQQMHLAFAGATAGTGMTLSWATFDNVADSTVWIGLSSDKLVQRADVQVESRSYYSEGAYQLYQHHATVLGLTPNTKYFYQVGSANASSTSAARSDLASFTTARAANDATPFDMAIYGDLGWGDYGSRSAESLNAQRDQYALIYHLGDIAYADDDFLDPKQALGFFYEEVYNKWMNSLTPVMRQVPYMTVVGNHEAECHSPACQLSSFKREKLGNYSAYNARFRMPSRESQGVMNMWYSFEYGPIHFTSISSETDFPNPPDNDYNLAGEVVGGQSGNFGNQLAWLEADLRKAAANRANVPWIFVGMHRPMYSLGSADAQGNASGTAIALQAAFENLLIKYQVDVVLAGHMHSYERQLPIARKQPLLTGVSADQKTYANVKAPIYIVSGGPGNPEPNKVSGQVRTPWNVLETAEYGISTVHVTRSALTFKYVTSTTATPTVLDQFVVTKS